MDLKIPDVAQLLGVSETTIRRWLAEGKIPAYRLHHQYRFSRPEIENWMMSCKITQKEKIFRFLEKEEPKHQNIENTTVVAQGWQTFSLYRSLHKGGIIFNSTATTKEELIKETTKEIAQKFHLDEDVIVDLLLDRERLMPTALNQGFAVPHTRDFLLKDGFDAVIIVFPKNPIDWGALDGMLVHTVFFLFACDDKHHLNLLAKLAHLSSDENIVHFLKNQPDQKMILEYIRGWELSLHDKKHQ
ncbi:MAG: PTS sugar transporter subunit IIA [Chlamydiales bacterium]|nr:PTS sugar transporter subunit IIA [Chlamydiales bacterium]